MRKRMKIARVQAAERMKLQMTPMIDVVFLLLIFFMVTSRFAELEGKFQTDLPRSVNVKQAVQNMELPPEVRIDVAADGTISVNGQPKTFDQLVALLTGLRKLYPKQPVVIHGDPATLHRYITDVLEACYLARITNISFESSF